MFMVCNNIVCYILPIVAEMGMFSTKHLKHDNKILMSDRFCLTVFPSGHFYYLIIDYCKCLVSCNHTHVVLKMYCSCFSLFCKQCSEMFFFSRALLV